jgi:hypothetical protein
MGLVVQTGDGEGVEGTGAFNVPVDAGMKRVTNKIPLEWEPEVHPISTVVSRTQGAGETDKAIG